MKGEVSEQKGDAPKTAYEKFLDIFLFINKFAYAMGVELVDDWVYSARSLVSFLISSTIWWVISYTAYVEFPSLNVIELLGGVAYTKMTQVKFTIIQLNHRKYMSVLNFILDVFKKNPAGGVRNSILSDAVDVTIYNGKMVFVGIVLGVGFYSMYPLYDLLINGNLTQVSPLVAPYVDQTTSWGFWSMTVYNIFIVAWASVFSVCFNGLFLTIVNVYKGMVNLIEHDLKLFDAMCERKHRTAVSRAELRFTFRNIMMEIMDLTNYNIHMAELYDASATIQIVSSYYAMIAILFSYLANDFVNGIGATIFFSIELFTYCYIGQLVEDTSEQIAEVVYDAKWYTYETNYQKDMCFALHLVQNLSGIKVASLLPLNFETGQDVAKNVYSMLMFMLAFLE